MVVGGYTLDLYCDFPDESQSVNEQWEHRGSARHPGPGFEQFTHSENGAGARKGGLANRARRHACPVPMVHQTWPGFAPLGCMSRPLSVFDQLLAGTPFRGLVLKGQPGYCAYIGVPESHWLADMEGLQFACHWGVTFRGPGGDGIRPEGWYWYGWDYQHAGDFLEFPEELLAAAPEIAALIPAPRSANPVTSGPG